jgi:hypothetical protein
MLNLLWTWLREHFKNPVWSYRFRYDNEKGAWLIEVSTNYMWYALRAIENNKINTLEFSSSVDAQAHADKIGLANVYTLVGYTPMVTDTERNQLTSPAVFRGIRTIQN